MIKINISIVTHKNPENFRNCLESIKKELESLDKDKYEITLTITANNAVFDVKAETKKFFSSFIFFDNKVNYSFSANHNRAFNCCESDYFLVLNDDIIIKNKSILKLLQAMEEDKSIASSGPILYERVDNKFIPKRCGGYLNDNIPVEFKMYYFLLSFIFFNRVNIKKTGQFKKKQDFEKNLDLKWITGACCLFRSSVYKQINGYDEDYSLYLEDVDIGYRLKKSGYKLIQVKDTYVIHLGTASFTQFSQMSMLKGIKVYSKKHNNFFMHLFNLIIVSILSFLLRLKK